MLTIAFQGERGAFSEDAAIKNFRQINPLPQPSLADVFEIVQQEKADFGVVPVENSQAGSINETYDLLLKSSLFISGEINLRVNHCLMGLAGESLNSIGKIYSHPQALAQCENFLKSLKVEIVPTYDTAGSAKMIQEQKLAHIGAIASKRASQIYGLNILAENIEDNPNNYTRFLVISREKAERVKRSKTSIVFATKNVPGALYASLGAFATRNINLIKLESRPSKNKPWEYVFYVDFEGYIDDKECQEALAELREKANLVKILGSYPKTEE
jgi:prephenate dehydratase